MSHKGNTKVRVKFHLSVEHSCAEASPDLKVSVEISSRVAVERDWKSSLEDTRKRERERKVAFSRRHK